MHEQRGALYFARQRTAPANRAVVGVEAIHTSFLLSAPFAYFVILWCWWVLAVVVVAAAFIFVVVVVVVVIVVVIVIVVVVSIVTMALHPRSIDVFTNESPHTHHLPLQVVKIRVVRGRVRRRLRLIGLGIVLRVGNRDKG